MQLPQGCSKCRFPPDCNNAPHWWNGGRVLVYGFVRTDVEQRQFRNPSAPFREVEMILVEMGETHFEGADPRLVGDWVRRHIANWGFQEFCITFGPDCEVEWTDPDLFLEWTDIDYFLEIGVPEAFVRRVFINWQVYVQSVRGIPFPKLGNSEINPSEHRKNGGNS